MTTDERVARAKAFVTQAIGRLGEVGANVHVPPDHMGTFISLGANLESALAELEAATPPSTTT